MYMEWTLVLAVILVLSLIALWILTLKVFNEKNKIERDRINNIQDVFYSKVDLDSIRLELDRVIGEEVSMWKILKVDTTETKTISESMMQEATKTITLKVIKKYASDAFVSKLCLAYKISNPDDLTSVILERVNFRMIALRIESNKVVSRNIDLQ